MDSFHKLCTKDREVPIRSSLDVLPTELLLIVGRYGAYLDEATRKPFDREEINWLLQTHGKFAIASYSTLEIEYIQTIDGGGITTDRLTATVTPTQIRYAYNAIIGPIYIDERCGPFLDEAKLLDLASIFRLLKRRFDGLGYEHATKISRKHVVGLLDEILKIGSSSSPPVFLEMYLCGCLMSMGLIDVKRDAGRQHMQITWPIYAQTATTGMFGGSVDDLRDGIIARYTEHRQTLLSALA